MVWCQISVQIGASTAEIHPLSEGVARGKSSSPYSAVNGNIGNNFLTLSFDVQIKLKKCNCFLFLMYDI